MGAERATARLKREVLSSSHAGLTEERPTGAELAGGELVGGGTLAGGRTLAGGGTLAGGRTLAGGGRTLPGADCAAGGSGVAPGASPDDQRAETARSTNARVAVP